MEELRHLAGQVEVHQLQAALATAQLNQQIIKELKSILPSLASAEGRIDSTQLSVVAHRLLGVWEVIFPAEQANQHLALYQRLQPAADFIDFTVFRSPFIALFIEYAPEKYKEYTNRMPHLK